MRAHAAVAQLVEQRIRNAKVASSTPASGTKTQLHPSAGPTEGRTPPRRQPPLKKLLFALLLVCPVAAFAEEDGNDLLAYMKHAETREVALTYIDAARKEWDATLFCIKGDDPQKQAFDTVRQYLETHPDELFRPRRYLVIQALRTGFPCKS